MSAVLWIIAAVMQLAAVVAYGVLGFGVVFCLLQLFVLGTGVLTLRALP